MCNIMIMHILICSETSLNLIKLYNIGFACSDRKRKIFALSLDSKGQVSYGCLFTVQ